VEITMSMKLEAVETTARMCARCMKMCRHVCTTHVVTRNEADTPNERCGTAYRAMQRGYFLPEEVPYMYEKCAVCGLCLEWCETHWDAGEVMVAARADIVDQGLAPRAAVDMNQHIVEQGNPYGQAPDERFAPVAEQIQDLPDQAEVLYFLGCDTLCRQPEIAVAAMKVMKAAGVDFTVLKDGERCCGEPQRLLGFCDAALDTARHNVAMIENSGAKRVVFTCPSCLKVMKVFYPEWGVSLPEGVELLHMTQFLQQLLAQGKITLSQEVGKRVTYHDSCDLGRRLEIYDAPREVIEALPGAEFVELQLNRSKSNCCGAGGGLEATNPTLVMEASKSVIGMARDVSAEILITACPTCKHSFWRHTYQDDGLQTRDIVELVALALGLDDAEA